MGIVGIQYSFTVSIPVVSSNTMRKAIPKPTLVSSLLFSSERPQLCHISEAMVKSRYSVSAGVQGTNIPHEFPGKTPDNPTPPIPPEVPGLPGEPSPSPREPPPDVPLPGQPDPKLPPDPDILPPSTPPDFPPPDMPPDISPPIGPSILI
ncbi:hypothetical protein LINPERHAP2_LOCUS4962 [Linum perenne]